MNFVKIICKDYFIIAGLILCSKMYLSKVCVHPSIELFKTNILLLVLKLYISLVVHMLSITNIVVLSNKLNWKEHCSYHFEIYIDICIKLSCIALLHPL